MNEGYAAGGAFICTSPDAYVMPGKCIRVKCEGRRLLMGYTFSPHLNGYA